MQTTEYKFVDGLAGRYAQITLSAEPATQPSVVLSSDVFDWLKEEYGPNAWEWPECDEWRSAAIAGAEFAMSHLALTSRFFITILKIDAHPAHSDTGAVEFATCHAIWKAIGFTDLPSFEAQANGLLSDYPHSGDAAPSIERTRPGKPGRASHVKR